MKHDKVGSVMTTDVVRAGYATPFKEVARLLADHRISGLPVVDADDKVVGVISESDLLARQARTADPYTRWRRLRPAGRGRGARQQDTKARARVAGQLMTGPPVTVHADDTIVEAARVMAGRRVERLPVLDEEDRLVGIVTRRDLLQVFLRPDREIRWQVIDEVLVRALRLPPRAVEVAVSGGVVTLTGHLERRGDAKIAVSLTRQMDGVVAVIDKLGFRRDDRLPPEGRATHGVLGAWTRGG